MHDTQNPPLMNQTNHERQNVEDFLMDLGNLSLEEIVGQPDAIRELKELVSSIYYKPIFGAWAVKSPRGILLTGDPGTGKTASVKALAKELGNKVCLMELRYVDIASKWVDAPIENLQAFFKLAEEQSMDKHVLIFIDEIDSMIPARDGNLHETSVKRVNVFLEWMGGGFHDLKNVTVIGATNNPDGVDKAARRAGRFDKHIEYKNLKASDIALGLKIHLSKRQLNSLQMLEIDWTAVESLVSKMQLSGADLPEIINRVLKDKVVEHIDNIKKSVPNFESLDEDLQLMQMNNPSFYPAPVVTSDLLSAIDKYGQGKGNDKKPMGFSLQSDYNQPQSAALAAA